MIDGQTTTISDEQVDSARGDLAANEDHNESMTRLFLAPLLITMNTTMTTMEVVDAQVKLEVVRRVAGLFAPDLGSGEPSPALQYMFLSEYRQEFHQTYYRQVDDGDR